MTDVDPIPEDFHTITPYLVVRDAARAVDVYQQGFGAQELYRNFAPDGHSIIHSELLLGDSRLFINEEFPHHGQYSPHHYGGRAVTLHLYVRDVDALYQRAVAAGAEVTVPLADQFWGDRYGRVRDPADGVARLTAGKGVDVVIDGVAGPLAGQAIASLAPGGRYVSVGYSGGTTATIEVTDPDLEVRAHTGSASASSPLRRFTRPG